ncbi:EAL domain-containing protein (putative c-di-GMP-specific phosphodiesterase class I) [Silvimonas terrae]|uniref:EAL domain-containing protein (Putative c-di-GMP-specific phosphodiesterase class I) n=1 Tax=Silvimonas terrae TaxID=300266 RepID=A0A840R808_9NEIS|nr:EAL domain-containing protein [Silvimonas terrae]MBB5189425.1 EAL domain-containing protein (putative c-di-GMP-specific phosphodiesterase class I) [Silvimonas terrae]
MKRKIALSVCFVAPLVLANAGLVWFAQRSVHKELNAVSASILGTVDSSLNTARQKANALHQQLYEHGTSAIQTGTECDAQLRLGLDQAISTSAFIDAIYVQRWHQQVCSAHMGSDQQNALRSYPSLEYDYVDGYSVLFLLRPDYFLESIRAQAAERYDQIVLQIGNTYLSSRTSTNQRPVFRHEWVAESASGVARVFVEASSTLAWAYVLDSIFTWNVIALVMGWLMFGQIRRYFSAAWQFDAALAKALQFQEITPYYQPVYHLSGLTLSGVEILARWKTADGVFIPADRFIARAEELDLIAPLTRLMMHTSSAQLPALSLPAGSSVALNLSAEALLDEHLIEDVIAWAEQLLGQGLQPVVELTERSFVDLSRTNRIETVLAQLQAHHVQVALDDFGAEYSSLGYLHRFAFDCIKIDGLFLDSLDVSPNADLVLDCILQLTAVLGVKVVVEKVETATQLAWLSVRQVDAAQGYFFGRPQPASVWQQPVIWPIESVDIAAAPQMPAQETL